MTLALPEKPLSFDDTLSERYAFLQAFFNFAHEKHPKIVLAFLDNEKKTEELLAKFSPIIERLLLGDSDGKE